MARATGLALILLGAAAWPSPVAYRSLKQGSATFHVVVADVNHESVRAATLFAPRLTSARRLLGDRPPVAAVTGTFFAWENQKPVADVVVEGDAVAEGNRGSVLAVDWFGRPHIFHPKFRSEVDWFPYRYALRGCVRLVEGGKVVPNPRAQRFRDPAIWGSAARTAVGLTSAGKVVLVATRGSVTLSSLGRAMRSLGATDAVSLDGGGSTALYYRGSFVLAPNRPLSTLFAIYDQPALDAGFDRHLGRITGNQAKGALSGLGAQEPGEGPGRLPRH
jgi:hypothetical protein